MFEFSFVCDALDGWFTWKFNQVSTIGVVLDMVKDRISTACLLVILSQVYSTFLVGKASHKDVNDSTNWLFKAHYGNKMFMGYCCVACEALYITLFLLQRTRRKI
ncbi:hypothetical protein RJ639_036764 [Escallonia herrerae]|uniref:Uncharacterized protein n=1 Tax=Escallonia herrerae TaxID=1293975 RepID=A0AA89B8V7_9ASTE|nr:hypothetical protein RJ639_036764 [Escallonia herrerae]